ncbi:TPA: DNA replication licensing factor, mcm4 component [Trebouxia sp. C0006]
MLDKANESTDKQLVWHLIGLSLEHPPEPAQAVIPMEKLRDFIAFARARCDPELTDEAGQDLVDAYTSMRSQGTSRKCITATPR